HKCNTHHTQQACRVAPTTLICSGRPREAHVASACVHCAQPATGTLCAACSARLRVLLASHAGVRHFADRSVHKPYALVLVAVLATLGGLARLLVGPSEPPPPQASGIWQVFDDQQFISPLGMAADRDGNLFVVDAGTHRVYKLTPGGEVLA